METTFLRVGDGRCQRRREKTQHKSYSTGWELAIITLMFLCIYRQEMNVGSRGDGSPVTALDTLAEDQGLVLGIHVAAHNQTSITLVQGTQHPLLASVDTAHIWCTASHAVKTHIHKINLKKFKIEL